MLATHPWMLEKNVGIYIREAKSAAKRALLASGSDLELSPGHADLVSHELDTMERLSRKVVPGFKEGSRYTVDGFRKKLTGLPVETLDKIERMDESRALSAIDAEIERDGGEEMSTAREFDGALCSMADNIRNRAISVEQVVAMHMCVGYFLRLRKVEQGKLDAEHLRELQAYEEKRAQVRAQEKEEASAEGPPPKKRAVAAERFGWVRKSFDVGKGGTRTSEYWLPLDRPEPPEGVFN
jgi:hypothetical protein